MAISQATISTYLGATKALAEYPPPLSFIMAALQVASGLANIAKIQSAGFKMGGHTGFGSDNEVKGPAHANEVVFESQIVKGQERDVLKVREILQSGIKASELVRAFEFAKTVEQSKENFSFSSVENTIQAREVSRSIETVKVLERRINDFTSSFSVENSVQAREVSRSIEMLQTFELRKDNFRSFAATESTASRIAPPHREVVLEPMTRNEYMTLSDAGADRIVETLQSENASLKRQIARFQNDYKRNSKQGKVEKTHAPGTAVNVKSLMESLYKSQRGR